jgi:hypothetical protein
MAVRSALVSGISLSLGCGAGAVAVSTMRRDIVDLQVDLSTSVRETHSQINPKIEPIYNPTVRLCARERESTAKRRVASKLCADHRSHDLPSHSFTHTQCHARTQLQARAVETPFEATQRYVAESWNKGVMAVHDTLSSKLR